MKDLLFGLCIALALVLPASSIASAASESYTPGDSNVNSIKACRPSDFVNLYPMSANAEAGIIHVMPECPVNIDGVWYKPEGILLFNGQRLFMTFGTDGGLYAFTDVLVMEDFIENEYGQVFDPVIGIITDGTGQNYSRVFDDWLFGGSDKTIPAYELQPDLTVCGWNDCISSAKVGTTAPLTLWEHIYYQGDSLTMIPNSDHSALTFEGWNDRASSIS